MSKFSALYFGFCLVALIVNKACVSGNQEETPGFRAINIISSIPSLDANDKYIKFSDTITIFYHKEFLIYRIPEFKSYSQLALNSEGEVIRDSLTKLMKAYQYFVFKKGEFSGVKYSSTGINTGIPFPVDSLLTANTITNFSAFFGKKKLNDSLVLVSCLKNGDIIEKYVPKIRRDQSYSDTTILVFSNKFEKIDFSFDRELEEKRRKKLVSVRIVFNSKPNSNIKFLTFRREIIFEIQEKSAEADEFKLIKSFFKS